ncbi:MAG: TIGR02099 family protein [Oleiphilaceae bacterium]|nr:TIGR02099 family protein [Oleiphilaceae bacterium]
MTPPPADIRSRHFLFRALLRLTSLIWWLALALLVVLALYAGLGRQLSQQIGDYRGEIEQALSEQLGQPVTIGSLRADWQWLDPVLRADNLELHYSGDQDRAIARLQHLRIRLDTLSSLLRLRLVFQDFDADGLDLTLLSTRSDGVQVEGLGLLQNSDPMIWLARVGTVLSDPSLRITRINLGLKMPDEPVRYLDIPQVDLIYNQGVFTASGRAMRSGTTDQLASFKLQGQHFFRGDFDGQLYVDLDSGRVFDGLLKGFNSDKNPLTLIGLDLQGEGWLTFQDGRPIRGTGRFLLPHLQLGTDDQTLAPLENVTAHVGWRRSSDANGRRDEVHLKDLSWRWDKAQSGPLDLRLSLTPEALSLTGKRMPVQSPARLAQALQLLPSSVNTALASYQPEGMLDQFQLKLPASEKPRAFEFTGQFSDLSVQPHGGAPGGSGLSGRLFAGPDGGWVDVKANDVVVDFPELFRKNWALGHLNTRIEWLREGNAIRLFSDRVDVEYQDVTQVTGAFDLRLDPDRNNVLGLKVNLKRGYASMLAAFVPDRILGEAFYGWLTQAVEAATVTEGVFYGHGTIGADRPANSFTTSMQYEFRDATVRYDPAWPRVTGASGRASVQGRNAHVRLDAGQVGGLALDQSEIEVSPGPRVSLATATSLEGSEVKNWLSQTPLQDLMGDAGQYIELSGDYDVKLGARLALDSDAGPPEVDVDIRTDNGGVRYSPADLAWTDLSGRIHYRTDTGFAPETLNGVFLGEPAEFKLAISEQPKRLYMTQYSQMAFSSLMDILTERALPGFQGDPGLEGEFDYSASLALTSGGLPAVTLESDLKGLAVNWPAPLAKTPAEAAPLTLRAEWRDAGLEITGNWQERLATRLRWRDTAFDRGVLAVGSGPADLPEMPGVIIAGDVAEFDVNQWRERFSDLVGPALVERKRPAGYDWLAGVRLHADALIVGGRDFPGLTVAARPEPDHWQIELESEMATGAIGIPDRGNEPLTVRLSHLLLPDGAENDTDDGTNVDSAGASETLADSDLFDLWQVADWPKVDVQIKDLRRGANEYGAWSFQLLPGPGTLIADDLTGKLKGLAFEGDLVWRKLGGWEETQLGGTISGGSLEALSGILGGQVPISNKKTRAILDLSWPSNPAGIELENMNGTASVRLDEGVILEKSDTAQLFRVFNVLNSDTLWRRLKLDFSDLYERGVSFDALSGEATFLNGTMSWAPELQIAGPSGAFKLSGSSDLAAESLNMQLVVVLPLTKNLPLAAILLGASGPVGGALFVLDKLLGEPLSKLTSATYSVKGSWDRPSVKLQSVFDTSK